MNSNLHLVVGCPSDDSLYIGTWQNCNLVARIRPWILLSWLVGNWRMAAARCSRAGFRKFSRKKIMHRARAARPRGFDSLPSLDPDSGRCDAWFSVMRSKIKIRTSSCNKAIIELYCMTKSEFWFSMIRPSKRNRNVQSFVLLSSTVRQPYV